MEPSPYERAKMPTDTHARKQWLTVVILTLLLLMSIVGLYLLCNFLLSYWSQHLFDPPDEARGVIG